MYICGECGRTFDEPAVEKEIHWELPGSPSRRYEVCPHCGSGGYEVVHYCALCCATVPESMSKYNLCEDCEDTALERCVELVDKWRALIEARFTKEEQRYLRHVAEYDERLQLWLL